VTSENPAARSICTTLPTMGSVAAVFAFAEELLRERAVALKHDVPLAVIGAAWILLRVAGHAHEVGDTLVFGLIGLGKVLHANDIYTYASLR
jgi:hypothetical protein